MKSRQTPYVVSKSVVPVQLINPTDRRGTAKTMSVLLNLDTGNMGNTMIRESDQAVLQLPKLSQKTIVRSVQNTSEEIPLYGPMEVYLSPNRTNASGRLIRISKVAVVPDDRPRLMGEADIVKGSIVMALRSAAVLTKSRSSDPRHPSGETVPTYKVDPLSV